MNVPSPLEVIGRVRAGSFDVEGFSARLVPCLPDSPLDGVDDLPELVRLSDGARFVAANWPGSCIGPDDVWVPAAE